MASPVKGAIKFMLVKPAENCTEDLLSTGPRLVKDNYDLSQTISKMYVQIWIISTLHHKNMSRCKRKHNPRDLDSSNILHRDYKKLIHLHLSRDCFMKISLQSTGPTY